MNQEKLTALNAMIEADDIFQSALEARYGKRAGDMRYRTLELPTDLKALSLAFQTAGEAYRAMLRETK